MQLFREALQNDLAAICSLGEEVNALHHDAWPQIFADPGNAQQRVAHWQQGIAAEKATTFVCEDGGRILGFVLVLIAQDPSPLLQPVPYARVGTISVAKDHWGKGIGRELVKHAERWASELGMSDLRLHVWSFNERALGLYSELGYEVRSHVLGKRLRTDA